MTPEPNRYPALKKDAPAVWPIEELEEAHAIAEAQEQWVPPPPQQRWPLLPLNLPGRLGEVRGQRSPGPVRLGPRPVVALPGRPLRICLLPCT